MADDTPPRSLPEPESPPAAPVADAPKPSPWGRGLVMIVFAVLFNLAQTVLLFCAVAQFLWLLIDTKRNDWIAGFGESLGRWLQAVARFQTGASEDRPFPWDRWPA
ncbi:MAG: DUF4389 domain-containing protein [Gemmobacter sp.]